MAFQQGLSGLNLSSKALDVVSNNIANAGTVGYKASNARFADVFAASLNGAGSSNVGIGGTLATVQQQFTQGNLTSTSNPLDVAINGGGFFRVSKNGESGYTRNGQFHVDKDNYIVNDQGYRLQGWLADSATGRVVATTPTDLKMDKSYQTPIATGSTPDPGIKGNVNLDSRDKVPTNTTFSTGQPDSYNYSTALTVFDSRGNSHTFTMYFVKVAGAGASGGGDWNVYGTVDGAPLDTVDMGAGAGAPLVVSFDTNGKLSNFTAPTVSVAWDQVETALGKTFGATTPQTFPLSFNGSTSYGSSYGTTTLTQDGYTTGQLTGINITPDGLLQGRYSNGQTRDMGRVVLYDFANPNGLSSMGSNLWAETYSSGQPTVGAPKEGNFGVVQSATVEESNVDLTAELVSMITMQRNYQANAQAIKTQDQVMNTVVNLR